MKCIETISAFDGKLELGSIKVLPVIVDERVFGIMNALLPKRGYCFLNHF